MNYNVNFNQIKILLLQVAITGKYGLEKSQQRIYLHYQPSFYHLHVHFTSLQFTPPGNRRDLFCESFL